MQRTRAERPGSALDLDWRLRLLLPIARRVTATGKRSAARRRADVSGFAARAFRWLAIRPGPRPAGVVHRTVPVDGGEIRVRVYLPPGPGPFPLYVFLHGGAWCSGTLDERDPRCAEVAAGADCAVASVEYRLAPENPFPTPPEDCYAALQWLVGPACDLPIDATRVAIGGESAGANLAAVVCLLARDRRGPVIRHQWLDVPATDATLAHVRESGVGDGYLLDADEIEAMYADYLRDPAQATDPRCSPLFASSHAGLPPAWIMTAGFDPLWAEGYAYYQALVAAGVEAHHEHLADHVHASFSLTRLIPSARAYQSAAIAALASALGTTLTGS